LSFISVTIPTLGAYLTIAMKRKLLKIGAIMDHPRLKTLTLLTLTCALAVYATASPFQRNQVAADPVWVIHLDCDALRPTAIGQFVLGELNKPEADQKLSEFKSMFSFDPRTELHSVTLYSSSMAETDAVMLLRADFDADHLASVAKSAGDYQSSEHNGHIIHSFVDDKKHGPNGETQRNYAAIQGDHLVILGKNKDKVAQALDVLDKKSPSLAAGTMVEPLGGPPSACFIQGAARKLDITGSDPNAAMLKLSKMIRLQVGEVQKQLHATLSLQANDEEVARHIASIAQGLVSLLKLQTDKPDATKLADAITLKQEGNAVVANLTVPSQVVLDMIKNDQARKAKKKEKAGNN
jgi:hypothetical protein